MNKNALLILLLVIAVGLLVWRLGFTGSSEEPTVELENANKKEAFVLDDSRGIPTDEQPEFNVVVDAKKVGNRNVLEFTVTETHGWAVGHVYVEASHRTLNEESGEWEQTQGHTVQLLCKGIVDFGKPLVDNTTLTDYDLDRLPDREMGTSENWEGRVYKWGKVLKPKE
jgi:hypothetical protein